MCFIFISSKTAINLRSKSFVYFFETSKCLGKMKRQNPWMAVEFGAAEFGFSTPAPDSSFFCHLLFFLPHALEISCWHRFYCLIMSKGGMMASGVRRLSVRSSGMFRILQVRVLANFELRWNSITLDKSAATIWNLIHSLINPLPRKLSRKYFPTNQERREKENSFFFVCETTGTKDMLISIFK